jgi:hypothetical protein
MNDTSIAYLIKTTEGTSEWKYSFNDVQTEMNRLESIGLVSDVTVQQYKNSLLNKEVVYNYNGTEWER